MLKEMELYVHIPFCIQKCRYCDFLSAPAAEDVREAYVGQMLKEIRAAAGLYLDYRVTSVFFGGGTPSLLTAGQMDRLLGQLCQSFCIQPDAEVTAECNPGTLDAAKLRAYKSSGINRLSMGLQSADGRELRLLGRIHTFGQFVANYRLAREAGFGNINVDIMSALPGQTAGIYGQTLQKVLELRPEHISAYSLSIEEGTPFYKEYAGAQRLREQGKAQGLLPTEDEERQMYVLTKEMLEAAGYHRYEISNYALDRFACQHNIGYWTRRNYLGIGLGAASFMENVRFTDTADLEEYLALDFVCQPGGLCAPRVPEPGSPDGLWHRDRERLDRKAQMEEFMFLGLRMMCGVSADRFRLAFGETMEAVYGEVLRQQLDHKLIRETGDGYCLTDFGIDLSNYVMAAYLLD